jgi:hypothetical protein
MPNKDNPKKEMRAAARDARKDAKVEKRSEKRRQAFLEYSNDNMKKYVKKHTPAQIKQMIEETPESMRLPWMTTYKAPTTMKKGGTTKYQTGGAANSGLGSAKAKLAAAAKVKGMKAMKPAASKIAKTGTRNAKYKMGGAKKYQKGGTPFQEYMKTPGAVASDTTFNKQNTPNLSGRTNIPSNPKLKDAFEKTFGMDVFSRSVPDYIWESAPTDNRRQNFDEYHRRMGPNRAKGGTAKATYKTGGMVNPNAKVSKQTVPGSKGVKSGVNPKATAAKKATGRTGGTSKAPRTAKPKSK